MFKALDIIPFRNNVLKTLGLLIVTKTIDAFTLYFEMYGVVWGELLLQHDSSVLIYTRYDDQRETAVQKESLIVNGEGSLLCISEKDRMDSDGLINLPEEFIVEIELFYHRRMESSMSYIYNIIMSYIYYILVMVWFHNYSLLL